MRRRRFATAAVAAVIAIAAVALLARLVDDDEGNRSADQNLPLAVGRAVITRGEDWAFVAWRGPRGLCTSIVFAESEGATSCGLPDVGASRVGRRPELVVGGTYQERRDEDLWVDGVVNADASRVEVELSDGRRLQAPIYEAPAELGRGLEFFLLRTRPPEEPAPTMGAPEPFIRTFSAYGENGRLLERFGPPAMP